MKMRNKAKGAMRAENVRCMVHLDLLSTELTPFQNAVCLSVAVKVDVIMQIVVGRHDAKEAGVFP